MFFYPAGNQLAIRLHALVSMTAPQFQLCPKEAPGTLLSGDEESQPVTSLPCKWKPPRKRKESILPLSEASFEKHAFSKEKESKPLEYLIHVL